MSLKDDCKCGHDRTHHYHDPKTGERCNCLAMHCDCRWFRDPGKPDPPKPEWLVKSQWHEALRKHGVDDQDTGDPAPSTPRMSKPHAETSCVCSACQAWMRKRLGGVWTIGAGGGGGKP